MLKFVFRDEWAVAWLLSVRGQAGRQAGRQADGRVALFAARASQTCHDKLPPGNTAYYSFSSTSQTDHIHLFTVYLISVSEAETSEKLDQGGGSL